MFRCFIVSVLLFRWFTGSLVHVSLCHCVTVSLCHCVTVSLVTVSLCHCVTVSLVTVPLYYRCFTLPLVHLCRCVTVSLCHCVAVLSLYYHCIIAVLLLTLFHCVTCIIACTTVSLCHCVTVSLLQISNTVQYVDVPFSLPQSGHNGASIVCRGACLDHVQWGIGGVHPRPFVLGVRETCICCTCCTCWWYSPHM